ncbi:hypothetical protein VN12_04130 [Pirellula sp. SH-Sr6A]|uniref:hypothetical protein n=1 Tax=Pirellula sp. SH-Sr6A TaxID=1632865 RepID=UPI00078D8C15|nr:hypothetical protein [Pirellula sp. SH-Sr6A]AMV31281.1 hypothetical protein VN12_04130 [Pirellula sp. SH-Sr6A]
MSATIEQPNEVSGQLITGGKTPILYRVSDAKIDEIRAEFTGIKILDNKDYERCTKAIAVCRTLRTDVEKCRKELKEEALEYGRRVDSEAKRLTKRLEEIEEPLKAEKARVDEEKERAKREAEEAKRKKLEARLELLVSVNSRINPMVVSEWSDEEFDSHFAAAKQAWEEAKRLEQQEAERKAKEEAERREAMRIEEARLAAERAELDRQRKEAEEAARIERERIEAERAIERQRLAEERAKIEEAQRIEREKLEAERVAIEAERDRLEREQRQREEAERAIRQRIWEEKERKEQERLDAIEAAERAKRIEEMKPDREKMIRFGTFLEELELPSLSTEEGARHFESLRRLIGIAAEFCKNCFEEDQ